MNRVVHEGSIIVFGTGMFTSVLFSLSLCWRMFVIFESINDLVDRFRERVVGHCHGGALVIWGRRSWVCWGEVWVGIV